MIQPSLHDWYVGQCLQGLLSHPENMSINEDLTFADEDARREVIFAEVVEVAFQIADAVMQLRKIRAGQN